MNTAKKIGFTVIFIILFFILNEWRKKIKDRKKLVKDVSFDGNNLPQAQSYYDGLIHRIYDAIFHFTSEQVKWKLIEELNTLNDDEFIRVCNDYKRLAGETVYYSFEHEWYIYPTWLSSEYKKFVRRVKRLGL